ncbi:MAG TPA: ATP-dependent DNA ligase [Candidatus Dormibacteraeota bacterium]
MSVSFTNLDEALFEGAGATKRDLVDYLDAMAERILPELRDRPLSVIRAIRGQPPFMQKNLPAYAPEWIQSVSLWAEASRREVRYALCNDRDTLLWFANQRAVEYHPTLVLAGHWDEPTHMVLDLDPPAASGGFGLAVRAAHLVHQVLADAGLEGAVKTSGAKGIHVFVPVAGTSAGDLAAAGRALAARGERLAPDLATTAFMKEDRGGRVFLDATRTGWATVVAAYSPRLRPGVPVSFPVRWEDLDQVKPEELNLRTAVRLLEQRPGWAELMPAAQTVSPALIEEGHSIPIARVQAMHEGKRRARADRLKRSPRSGGPAGP